MARFVEGNLLNAALEDLIRNADEYLFLISPYIKLHSRIKDQLKLKKASPELEIVIVFGKSEDGKNRLSDEDLDFLKEFPNIEIRYEKNLHAKYYASEDGALITSLNLYDFSQNHNIEAGVWMETPKSLVGKLTGWGTDAELDQNAFSFFTGVIENSELLYKRVAVFESAMLGFKKKYVESILEVDEFQQFGESRKGSQQKFSGFKTFEKKKQEPLPTVPTTGFCIRTGKEIPFNVDRPFSYDAYQKWAQFSNEAYSETFCHFSGERSNGETSKKAPIMKKNWKVAKETWKF